MRILFTAIILSSTLCACSTSRYYEPLPVNPGASVIINLALESLADGTRIFRAAERDHIAVRNSFYAETLFKQCEIGVIFAEKLRDEAVVLKRNDEAVFCRQG